ncbi:MAG: hypothetical protein AB4426_09430 [Xenococcaceae cyanobacterium]
MSRFRLGRVCKVNHPRFLGSDRLILEFRLNHHPKTAIASSHQKRSLLALVEV